MNGLSEKVVLVAGGATGIGAAVVRRLAEAGARVAIGDLFLDRAEGLVGELRGAGFTARAFGYDSADPASNRDLVAAVHAAYGRLDGVLANAADISPATYGVDTTVVDVEVEIWERTLDTTLHGYFHLARHAVPHLLDAGGGSIVMTSSDAVYMADAAHVSYAVAKAGVTALVRHIASAWGKEGVRCNSVAPGLTMSEIAVESGRPDWHDRYLRSAPTPRLGVPDDIASVITFLLSDDARYVNGQVWSVNGGYVMR